MDLRDLQSEEVKNWQTTDLTENLDIGDITEPEPIFSEEEIKILARTLFQKYTTAPDIYNAFKESSYVNSELARLSGQSKAWADHRITPEFQQASEIFLRELIDFIKELKKNDPKSVPIFVSNVHSALFALSPSILSNLNILAQLRFAALTTRVPEAQAFVGGGMMGEVTYSLAFADKETTHLLYEDVISKPIAEQLDYLNVYETIGITAAANGGWADDTLRHLLAVIDQLSVESPYPLMRYASAALKRVFEQEWIEPSQSAIQISGNREYGRTGQTSEDIFKNHNFLSRAVIPAQPLVRGERLTWIAEDAIGISDQSGLVHNLALKVHPAELNAYEGANPVATENILSALKADIHNPQDIVTIIDQINTFVLSTLSSEEQAVWWQDCAILTPEEWKRFLQLEQQISALQTKYDEAEADLQAQAEEINRDINKKFIDNVLHLTNSKNSHKAKNQIIEEMAEVIQTYLNNGDLERALDTAEQTAYILSTSGQEKLSTEAQHLVDKLSNDHRQTWEKFTKDQQVLRERLEHSADWLPEYLSLRNNFAKQPINFSRKTSEMVGKEKEKYAARLAVVEFTPGEEACEDPTTMPFGATTSSEQDWLLFQQLHQPRVREYIENFFNISLEEIPLRNQIHFLHFLAEKDQPTMDRLAEALNQPNLNKEAFLKSFFACTADKRNGDLLLEFVELVPTEKANVVFTHYASLVDTLNAVEQEVHDFFVNKDKSVDTRKVVQEMVKRSNRTLLSNLNQGQHLDLANLETQLSSVQSDVILFSSIFKTASKENKSLSFNEIKGFDLSRKRGTELTDNEKEEMKKIFAQNYAKEPEFIARFHNFLYPQDQTGIDVLARNEFTIVTQNITDRANQVPKVATFLRLEDRGENELYFAANNVDPVWQSSGLGRATMESTLLEAAKSKRITATFPTDTEVGPFYIDQLGFVGTGAQKEMGKYQRFKMELNPQLQPGRLHDATMIDLADHVLPPGTNPAELIANNLEVGILQFTLPAESPKAFEAVETLSANGYVLTRYLIADQPKNIRWYGFEKKSNLATYST